MKKKDNLISVITAIGKLDNYIEFIDRYYENIQEQTIFDKMEFTNIFCKTIFNSLWVLPITHLFKLLS